MEPENQVKTEVNWEHKWLYSVIPAGRFSYIYLVAYCKYCDTATSRKVSTVGTDKIVLEKMGIPQYGCKSPV